MSCSRRTRSGKTASAWSSRNWKATAAFDEVGATLDLIEGLRPRWVVPGHGRVFGGETGAVDAALARARSRLDSFVRDPARHARHAAKVLLKFKLLELREVPWSELEAWALRTGYFDLVIRRYSGHEDARQWLASLADDLVKAGAARMAGGVMIDI